MYGNLTVLKLGKERMDWIAERQEVIAENIANLDTPRYVPRDVRPFDEVLATTVSPVPVAATNPKHFTPQLKDPMLVYDTRKTYENAPDKNGVVLEEQMDKLRKAKSAYDTSANLVQKQFKMFRTALKGQGN